MIRLSSSAVLPGLLLSLSHQAQKEVSLKTFFFLGVGLGEKGGGVTQPFISNSALGELGSLLFSFVLERVCGEDFEHTCFR